MPPSSRKLPPLVNRTRVRPPGFQAPPLEVDPLVPGPAMVDPDHLPLSGSGHPLPTEPEPESPAQESKPGNAGSSSGAVPSSPISSIEALERAVAEAIAGAGELANQGLTTEAQEAAGLYLTDPDDQKRLAGPLASLLARRAGPGLLNPDLADALAAAIALALYASKQLTKLRELKRARSRGQEPTDHTPTEDVAAA